MSVYSSGLIGDLDREKIDRLAKQLQFAFDWTADTKTPLKSVAWPEQPPKTAMQSQAAALLDRYSLRATTFILDKVRAFAAESGKKLMVVLFDPYRAMVEIKQSGKRYDQEIVDYLVREKVIYFDMNQIHVTDFKRYNVSWEDYMKQYFIGHYNPTGNHFFAFSIKDKVIQWLEPKPTPYQDPSQQSISFKNYLKGYK
jgi:hypothetical protein